MIDKNEIKKELYKLKTVAEFTHYVSGNLYYRVHLSFGTFQFPISTIEMTTHIVPSSDGEDEKKEIDVMILSTDLGETAFKNEIKASELNRWISKAIDNNEFKEIKIDEHETLIESLSKAELISLIKTMQ